MAENNCGCSRRCECSMKPICLDNCQNIPLAMVYVKSQEFGKTFEPMKGLSVGTIFPELCKPFMVQTRGCVR